MVVGIRKLRADQDGWIHGANVPVANRFNRQVRLIAYYVLFAGELLDRSVIRPAISVSQRDNCQ